MGDQCLDLFKFPISIGNYSCADLEVAEIVEMDLAYVQINTFGDLRHNFDPTRNISAFVNQSYKHQPSLEDHWENCVNEK